MSEQQPLLDQYCDNLANYLTQHCTWLKSAHDYRQQIVPIKTPYAFINIAGWHVANNGPHSGQTSLCLDVQILVVESQFAQDYRRTVRNGAAELTCAISDSTLNMPFHPAQVVCAQPYTLDKAVWEIRYQHSVDFGQNLFETEGTPPTKVRVGVSPDIGIGHKDDYQQVIPEPTDE
ncbi:hypothetical protein [Celerinatantimonas diazotrophica]|nr:hypothetical protein [Celerinatantimonas diazotrophica]